MRIFFDHQFKILLSLTAILLVTFIFWILLLFIFSEPQGKMVANYDDLESCTNNFCELLKKIHQDPDNILLNGFYIFKNNLIGTYYVLTSQPIILNPLLDTFFWGRLLATSMFNSPSTFFYELIFPHGLVEISSFIFVYSFFYAFILNLILVLKKKYYKQKNVHLIKKLLIKSMYQTILFLLMLFTAGILEAIGISLKA